MSSHLDGPRRSRRSTRIAAERAEILGLIEQLRTGQDAKRRLGAVKVHGTTSGRTAERPRSDSIAPAFMKDEAVVTLLRSLEVRLGLLEERMGRSERRSSRPAPPPSQAGASAVMHTFAGVIQGQMLSDMLQLVSSNNMSGKFVVDDEDRKCSLYFDEGRICHAESGDIEGENAFFAAFSFEAGRYFFDETRELPAKRTINSSTQFLILEALRQIDENNA